MPKKGTAGDGEGRRPAAEKKTPARKRAPAGKKAEAPGLTPGAAESPPPPPPPARVGARLRVKQVRSGIGHAETYRRTLEALGLKHHQDVVTVPDNPSVRGMLRKVWNLVSVESEKA